MFEYLKKHVVEILLWLISVILAWLLGKFQSLILPLIKNWSPEILIWFLLGFFFLFLIAIFLVIYYYGQLHPKNLFKTAFGIFWDKNKNPLCPINKSPLSNYDSWEIFNNGIKYQWGFNCSFCNKVHLLMDENGNNIELKDALNKL